MRIITIFIFSILISFSANAQHNKKRGKIKALKVSFITEKLNLSEKEAQEFWPIYNAYENKMHEFRYIGLRSLRKEIKENSESMSEDRANELLNKFIEIEDSTHKERTQLITKLKGVISAKKIIRLKATEEDFKRKILDQYKNHKRGETNQK